MKIKDILIVVLIALIGYLFFFRNTNTHTSSLIIEEVHDTTYIVKEVPIKELVLDTFYELKTDTFIKEGSYPLNSFKYPINDSLLTGEIIAEAPFKPKIEIKYKVKSFSIKDSVTIIPPTNYSGFFYGGSLVFNPLGAEIYLDGAKSFKNGNMINLSVGLNMERKQAFYKIGFLKKF